MATIPTSDREVVRRARHWAGSPGRSWIAPVLLTVAVAAGVLLEWVYSPVERALGAYMVWSQPVRQEVGRGWDLNREGNEALATLSDMADRTRQRRTAGATLKTWAEIPAVLDSFQVFSISPDRFLDLYARLPQAFQEYLLDPVKLMRARSSGEWKRVFFVEEGGLFHVYLVSSDNVTLVRGELTPSFFERYERLGRPVSAALEETQRFPMIIEAETFYSMLHPNGPVDLDGGDIRWISSLEGTLNRVGLASHPNGGMWELGFEVKRSGRTLVHLYWVRESVGWQLLNEIRRRVPVGGLDL